MSVQGGGLLDAHLCQHLFLMRSRGQRGGELLSMGHGIQPHRSCKFFEGQPAGAVLAWQYSRLRQPPAEVGAMLAETKRATRTTDKRPCSAETFTPTEMGVRCEWARNCKPPRHRARGSSCQG
jgi:hypothetical protein